MTGAVAMSFLVVLPAVCLAGLVGRVDVTNARSCPVYVFVGKAPLGKVRPGETLDLALGEGAKELSITSRPSGSGVHCTGLVDVAHGKRASVEVTRSACTGLRAPHPMAAEDPG